MDKFCLLVLSSKTESVSVASEKFQVPSSPDVRLGPVRSWDNTKQSNNRENAEKMFGVVRHNAAFHKARLKGKVPRQRVNHLTLCDLP